MSILTIQVMVSIIANGMLMGIGLLLGIFVAAVFLLVAFDGIAWCIDRIIEIVTRKQRDDA